MADNGYRSLTSLFEQEIVTSEDVKSTNISMIIDNQYAKDFLFGGNCHCTIENTKTGNKFSYAIIRNTKQNNQYWVHCDGEYCGFFYENFGGIDYRKGEKGNHNKEDQCIQVLLYVLNHIKYLPKYIIIEHEGRCSCCGSVLEDSKSIMMGLCPMCAKV